MLGFIFTAAPFGHVSGREGLDAVLATSNYSNALALFFISDGVMQLLAEQDSSALLCKDHVKTFKLLPLCDVENIYVCQDSLRLRGLHNAAFVVDAVVLPAKALAKELAKCSKILRF